MENLRSEPRFIAHQSVTIDLLDSGGVADSAGTIVDFSEHGIGLEAEAALASGARVRLRWDRGSVVGEVRYCRQTLGKFRIGIKIASIVATEEQAAEPGAA